MKQWKSGCRRPTATHQPPIRVGSDDDDSYGSGDSNGNGSSSSHTTSQKRSIDFQLASIRSPCSLEISVREIPAGDTILESTNQTDIRYLPQMANQQSNSIY
ncbi:hypothetical protein M0804_003168 [Polistes exclamans]|nr:hypothetical protein M0804_003168 [Polistes exclamans]